MLDTGVAYATRPRFRRSPDLRNRFVRGYDFVDDDAYPDDQNGHGTHVASTIAETTNNGIGLTGLAYGARIMPVRVLDRLGDGRQRRDQRRHPLRGPQRREGHQPLARVRLAASRAAEIPDILDALRYARRKGVLVVGASGNEAGDAVAYPARAGDVLSVGATTEHGCLADYSNAGSALDIVAPGGGLDADVPGDPNCHPGARPAGPRHLPDDATRSRSVRPLRAAQRLRGHLDGRAARVGDRGARHRLRRARPPTRRPAVERA